MAILVPVSAGELADKITILRIKAARIDPAKRANVVKELSLLEAIGARELPAAAASLVEALQEVNATLWDVEEAKRDCERRADFGVDFIALARRVYLETDRRAALKRGVNELLGSEIVEEKSYAPYAPPATPQTGER
jgi:hypothetical protein